MKKVFLLLIACVCGLFVGCSEFSTNRTELSSCNPERREILSFYAANGQYNVDQSEMEQDLVSVLFNSEYSRSVITENPFKITRLANETIESCSESNARSAFVESFDNVNVYLYNLENTINGSEGFAITSDDRRVGTVLAFVSNTDIDSVADNPFFEIFYDNLLKYIDETFELWNDLSDDEIEAQRASAQSIFTSDDYSFSNWQYNSGNAKYILKTQWGQRYPYNNLVNQKLNDGQNYPTGCGPTALAQLLSGLEYPTDYNWQIMKTNPNARYISSEGQELVAQLMYDLGIGLKASYTPKGTGCSNSNLEKYLKNNGYTYSGFKDYNFNQIQNSIDCGFPVMAQGYATKKTKKKKFLGITFQKTTTYLDGHYWIIDAYARFSCDAINIKNGNVVKIVENFVHCNLGWNGTCNGYYLNGVFDTRHVPLEYLNDIVSSTGYSSSNYAYKQKILTNLHHE